MKTHTSSILKATHPTSNRDNLLKLPAIPPFKTRPVILSKADDSFKVNPFKMPDEAHIFELREENIRLKKERREEMSKKIHEKSVKKRTNAKQLLAEDADDIHFYEELKKRDSDKFLINGYHKNIDQTFSKESLQEFVVKKREMFLVQYALGVKRQEMQKLEEIAQDEEEKLLEDEKALEDDATKFDAFLKENDKTSVDAIKKAEIETKWKLEKVQEVKKLNLSISVIKSEMSKNEDQLKDLQQYRQFLEKLTKRHFALPGVHEKEVVDEKIVVSDDASKKNDLDRCLSNELQGQELLEGDAQPKEITLSYFSTPQQLLDIFSELEENNLQLIQNCQETEETLEDLRVKISETSHRMDLEVKSLRQQIILLTDAISKEDEKSRTLEEKSRAFSSGIVGTESQEKVLSELNYKVREAYKKCMGEQDASLPTLMMLTNMENKLESLFESIELISPDKIEQAEKIKDKERRQRLREEKLDAQRILQEVRMQKALERASAPVKKKVGKPVVFRSTPPQKKKKKEESSKRKEEEDEEYYFT